MESQTYLAVPQQVYLAPSNAAQGNGASTASFASSITLTNASDDKHIALPPKRQTPWIRNLRHTWLAVYQRLFATCFFINMIALSLVLRYVTNGTDLLSALATGSSFNILVTVGIRQSFAVNLIYKTCWIVPKSWPLFLRCKLAKVYELGGIHSGAAYSSTLWFIAFTGHIISDTAKGTVKALALAIIACMLVLLLVCIIVLALPGLRSKRHNTFEWTHRFGGWISLILFWIELNLFAQQIIASSPAGRYSSSWSVLAKEPALWFLLATTLCIFWPWLLLRKLYVTPEYLSDRAIRLHFTGYKVPPFCGISISKSPLFEWHPFACMATQPSGGSLIISKAGDWTADTVCNPQPYYWVKGIPVTGVLNMAQVFTRVVVITTGSGIGPCLSYLIGDQRTHFCRIIWSAPSPIATFGEGIVDTVKKIDSDAAIIDTKLSGRLDLVALVYQHYLEFDAEAVFVISNPDLTKKVVYGMVSRGVPAFGPIWDS